MVSAQKIVREECIHCLPQPLKNVGFKPVSFFAKACTVDELMFHFFHMTTAHREDLWACQAPALHALRDDMRWKCFHKAGVRRRDMKDLEYVDRKKSDSGVAKDTPGITCDSSFHHARGCDDR